jgi:hypothetical protein
MPVLGTLSTVIADGSLRPRYEAAVLELRMRVAAMRSECGSPEAIARAVRLAKRRSGRTMAHRCVWAIFKRLKILNAFWFSGIRAWVGLPRMSLRSILVRMI